MRKSATIITAFIFLFSATELHELVRIPFFIGHYFHHQHGNSSLSLAGFIQLHYQPDHPADNDDGEDQQLPFKSGIDSLKTDITNTLFSQPVADNDFSFCEKVISFYPEGVPRHRPHVIFHPPRQC